MCGGVLEGPWSARWTQITLSGHWLGPGNTNIPLYRPGTGTGWVLPLPTQYPVPPAAGAVPGLPRGTVPTGHAHMTVLDHPKEILGVNNAHYRLRTATGCRTPHLTQVPPSPWAGFWDLL